MELLLLFIVGIMVGWLDNLLVDKAIRDLYRGEQVTSKPVEDSELESKDPESTSKERLTREKTKFPLYRRGAIYLISGVISSAIWPMASDAVQYLVWVTFFSLLLILLTVDLVSMRLPNLITTFGLGLGWVLGAFGITLPWQNALLGSVAGFGIVVFIMLLSRGGMGLGDAKLLAMIGAFLGPWGAIQTLFWGSTFGSVYGLGLILSKRADRKQPVPFGPWLSLGAALVWAVQELG